MGAFTVLPVALRIEGRRCLVVGGGRVAEQKIAHLLEAGADVTVVSPVICEALARAHSTGRLTWRQGTFIPDDLAGVDLVFTATNDPLTNAQVAVLATRRHLFVNSADDPSNCTFFMTANVHRGPVTVSVSTGGSSPAVASYLRRLIEREIGEEIAEVARLVAAARDEVIARGESTEAISWSDVVNDELVELVRRGDTVEAANRLRAITERVAP